MRYEPHHNDQDSTLIKIHCLFYLGFIKNKSEIDYINLSYLRMSYEPLIAFRIIKLLNNK